ncbi:glycosyltransferase [Thalassotalea sp. G2M2-11]|uniref:glycosyltransferase n=1 Tax=Thalassotalea sp. G2M2-11 TaxID=2787627 RepID=UPI0019D1BF9D|nr:glycosyltransferase [Thalassotalea sp. G2M2-11]
MKVLHILKTSIGASWALRQTTQLIKLGVDVHLVLPHGPMVEKYQQAGVKTYTFDPALSVSKPWLNISRALKLRALVKQVQPDIIHSHFVATSLLMRIALKGINIPQIFHVPGPLHLEHWLFRTLDKITASSKDYWLASCLWTREKYHQLGIKPHRVGLAYYGVNEDDFAFEKPSDNLLKESLAMAQEDFLIIMVAYFYAPKRYLGQTRGLKGHEDLIDAVAIVQQRYPNIKCVFVGGPWGNAAHYFDAVKSYSAKKIGASGVFLGTRTDVAQLYPQCDLAVHPSHSENVGGAVESMYAKVPTLTTNVGGFPDLVTDGETGYLAEKQNPQALADKIIQAIEQPIERKRLVNNAYRKVRQVMNVEHNAKQVFDFYQQVLSARQ